MQQITQNAFMQKDTNTSNWQQLLANVVTDPAELLQLLEIDPQHAGIDLAEQAFKLRVPRGFIARMKKGDINDPLLRQVLPLLAEKQLTPGYSTDPTHEATVNPVSGLLHKYHGRVLLTVTGGCAINCRYCFRRHFPYSKNNPGNDGWTRTFDYIRQDHSIHEVIFSGGDPLAVTDKQLSFLANQIATIPHIKTLRIHTRVPVVLPERINDELLQWLNALPLRKILVVHSNHTQEFDAYVDKAMQRLRNIDVTLLNQSVLLKGVNDSITTLIDLSKRLFSVGILPYYLNLLDKVQGAAHFDVDESIAKELIRGMQTKLPGYLVPRLMREEAGAESKILI